MKMGELSKEYVMDYNGKILKVSEIDPDMYSLMSMTGAIRSMTEGEVKEYKKENKNGFK